MRITRDNLHQYTAKMKLYNKIVPTRAIKIDTPFLVETEQFTHHMRDGGYLAVDARGYPYGIATEEFNLIYEEVKNETDTIDELAGDVSKNEELLRPYDTSEYFGESK